ncbi:dimethyladenosine transferase [Syntrophobotulus glycolicus DSM 8271]|uniref:Ribosomal RNA small subunit methyltransferase A n=1 Tax=Syntrophobotulus glycolicus (strain DSM 8271 / FlGlyR) TaxID=645991 RepID=F0SW70_SYNGF|nr:16S rRNA (adenine(1518)-N(6)/adenine(1519)-N(6))-dimethyltransferase RsmA [Syntrophobotulus glycolicus]ADY54556.1 dimethyladenosine transferase [Syntrophobotulus glycolicus DSM 8271]
MNNSSKDLKRKETLLQYTKRVLRGGKTIRKSLGQNFLVSAEVVESIVAAIGENHFWPVVEIGSGPGGLTRALAEKVDQLWAVELDQENVEILREEMPPEKVKILQADALKLNLEELWGKQKGWLVGNLPYYITNPLLMHFLEQSSNLFGMIVMVQKEVAERMTAKPGGKEYGILSIAVQLAADARILFEVPPTSFHPQPKVTSAVVRLDIRPFPDFDCERDEFFRIVKAAFAQRRKTLANALSAGLHISKEEVITALGKAGLEGKRRAETLSIADFQEVTRQMTGRKQVSEKNRQSD